MLIEAAADFQTKYENTTRNIPNDSDSTRSGATRNTHAERFVHASNYSPVELP